MVGKSRGNSRVVRGVVTDLHSDLHSTAQSLDGKESNMLVSHSHYPARACASRGLCDWGWYPFVCMYVCRYVTPPKKFEWQFSGQLTFSNTCGRLLVEFVD